MDFLVESEKCGWPMTPNPRGSCERVEILQEIEQNGNRPVLHSFYNCLIGFRPFDFHNLLK